MRLLRRLLVLAALAVGAAVLSSPALAARPGLPDTIGSTHFLVHFETDPTHADSITATEAADIATLAERAYAAETADGYSAPPSDGVLGGDGRTDIYVMDLSATGALALSIPDNGTSPDSGYIELDGADPEDSFTLHVVAHELFHLVQFGIWVSSSPADDWLYEGSAEWMGFRVDGYAGSYELGPDEMSLDCLDPTGGVLCDLTDPYIGGGYSRWPFFEYLSEKFGTSFLASAFAQGQAGAGSATASLAAALAAKGTTLADTYNAWSTVQLTGGYSVTPLQTLHPTPYAVVQTGTASATLPVNHVTVNHLATRYVELVKGNGDASATCYQATLTIVVSMPAGTLSKPMFYWDVPGTSPVALTISGNTASAAVPWDTCTWAASAGWLSLPNASTTVDAADFVVNTSISVDTTKPAAPSSSPTQQSVYGQVVAVPSTALPPDITVYGPELITLSSSDKQLRLIVSSGGDGLLAAKIGSTSLGSLKLSVGNNDLRYTIPSGVLNSVRSSADLSNILTVTSVAPTGGAQGQSVTRKIVIQGVKTTKATAPAKKTKAKAVKKPAPKSKKKSSAHK